MTFLSAYLKELLELHRTRKTLIALVVLVLFGMTSPLIAKITPQIMTMVPGGESFVALIPEPTIQDAIGQYIKNISQFGILLALVFGMGSISVEKEKGTAAMILAKPVSRTTFILAKFSALVTLFTIALLIAGLACYYYTYFLFGPLIPDRWMIANGLILIYLIVYLSITLLFSTITRSQYIAIASSFGVLIIFGLLGNLPILGANLPDGLISNAAALVTGDSAIQWNGVPFSLGLILISLASACLIFGRQEL